MATLQAASRSLWGSSRCRGAWALGLRTRGDSCCGSQPRESAQSLRAFSPPRLPARGPGPSCTACAPRPCFPSSLQFPVAGGQLEPGLGSGVAPGSAADLGII